MPLNPGRHAQVRLPGVLVQIAPASQPSVPRAHSFISTQFPTPEPVYPPGQAPHVGAGAVVPPATGRLSVHETLGVMEQPPLLVAHSFTFWQPPVPMPVPVAPAGHVHVRVLAHPPAAVGVESVHFARAVSQPPFDVAHSLIFVQTVPDPVNPVRH